MKRHKTPPCTIDDSCTVHKQGNVCKAQRIVKNKKDNKFSRAILTLSQASYTHTRSL